MDNFIVSARKYRPVSFDRVIGQEHVTNILKNAVASNQLAQVLLFCGPRGVGKTTCARILAKTVNCENRNETHHACGTCTSCMAFSKNASYNIIELDAASNNSVEDIRSIVEQVRYPPHSGNKKVYIIDEVHMLSNQAFNAFLKTLEEPPSYIIFILATTEKYKIIPTILSRCQIFDFKRMSIKHITTQLQNIAEKENIPITPEALHLISKKADGAMRDALSLFDMLISSSPDRTINHHSVAENLYIIDQDYYFSITDHLINQDFNAALLSCHEILKKGFDEHHFIIGLVDHFRNLLVAKHPQTIFLLETSESISKKYITQAEKINNSFLFSAIDIGHQADLQFKQVKNRRLHIEVVLMKIFRLDYILQDSREKIFFDEKKNIQENTNSNIRTIQKVSTQDSKWKNTMKIKSDLHSVKKQIKSQHIPKKKSNENQRNSFSQQEKFDYLKEEYPQFIELTKKLLLELDWKN